MCSPRDINCFNCNNWFIRDKSKECEKCGEIICPHCNSCLCKMTDETKKAVIAMIKTYENFLSKKFRKQEYNFNKHNRILKRIEDI